MRQSDVYELLKKHGPMTINQLVDVAYPDTPAYQFTIKRVDINKKLNQLMLWDMVCICGKSDTKQNIWKSME